jgi:hypothetical protein
VIEPVTPGVAPPQPVAPQPPVTSRRLPPRQRSWLEVRWRQLRNAPPPVTRAVAANLIVAVALAVPLLAYDLAIRGGSALPGGDLRTAAVTLYVFAVIAGGSAWTYRLVPLPSGSSGVRRRTAWSAALGALAALPIAYLALVTVFQIVEPALGPP